MGGSGGSTPGQVNKAVGNLAGTGATGAGMLDYETGKAKALQNQVSPFYTNRMQNGLPFYRNMTDFNSGNIAQAYAPIRADLLRRTSSMTNLPSGYRQALLTSLGAQQGRAFDSTLTQAMMANEMAKQQGAAGVSGQQQVAANQALGYGGLGAGADQGVIGAPQRTSGWGTVGGMLQGGLKTGLSLASLAA